MKRILSVLMLCLVLSGCINMSPWVQLQKEEYSDNSRGFKAVVPVGWMRLTQAKSFYITYDGDLLNSIVVEKSKFDEILPNIKRKFSAEMTPQELSEVQIDILKSSPHVVNVEIASNRPATVDGKEGFVLEYSFFTEDGLKYLGKCVGFSHGKNVILIRYQAPSQHYFAKTLPEFEKFLASFRLLN